MISRVFVARSCRRTLAFPNHGPLYKSWLSICKPATEICMDISSKSPIIRQKILIPVGNVSSWVDVNKFKMRNIRVSQTWTIKFQRGLKKIQLDERCLWTLRSIWQINLRRKRDRTSSGSFWPSLLRIILSLDSCIIFIIISFTTIPILVSEIKEENFYWRKFKILKTRHQQSVMSCST